MTITIFRKYTIQIFVKRQRFLNRKLNIVHLNFQDIKNQFYENIWINEELHRELSQPMKVKTTLLPTEVDALIERLTAPTEATTIQQIRTNAFVCIKYYSK